MIKKTIKPRIHYTLNRNTIIKCAGFVYFKEMYHLFSLHSPYKNEENTYSLAHSVSDDGLFFKENLDAVYPTLIEDIDGVEDTASIVINDKLCLFYIANQYSRKDERNFRIHDLNSVYETNVLVCFSEDGYNFDNTLNKKVIISSSQLKEIGFLPGNIEAISAFSYTGDVETYYICIVCYNPENQNRDIAIYAVDEETLEVKFLSKQVFIESKYRVSSISVNYLRDSVEGEMLIACAITKDERTSAYQMIRDLVKYSRSYCIIAKFNPIEGTLDYDVNTKTHFDLGEDITSLKVGLDKRNRLMTYCCVAGEANYSFSSGIISIPKRINFLHNGTISFETHPVLQGLFKNKLSDERIRMIYLPLNINFDIETGQYVDIGGLVIYKNNQGIHVSREKILNLEETSIERKGKYDIPYTAKKASINVYIDKDIIEIAIDEFRFLTLYYNNLGIIIDKSDGLDIQLLTMNNVK